MTSESLSETLQDVDRRKTEWENLQPVSKDRMEKILRKIRTEWNYNSNAIEGNRINLGETRRLIAENRTPQGKTFEEIRDIHGHDRAITRVYDWVARKIELTEIAVRDLHTILMVEEHEVEAQNESGQKIKRTIRLGQYKELPNFVTINGKPAYYTLPQDVPAQMHTLLTWYRKCVSDRSIHPIILASVFHHTFTKIHPFDDGNGRLGRLLLNYVLMAQGYVPVILNFSEREAYISALRAADSTDDALPQLSQFVADSELASLDLHCKGARGEDVEEITDLDKVVLMLKQQLSRAEEPEPKTKDTLLRCFAHSLSPLITRTTQKLSEFNEFFTETSISLALDRVSGERQPDKLLPLIKKEIEDSGTLSRVQLDFNWRGFKKAGLKVFDFHTSLQCHFKELNWTASPGNYVQMYQQKLSEDAIRKIVDTLRKSVISKIETELGKS